MEIATQYLIGRIDSDEHIGIGKSLNAIRKQKV